MPRVSTKPKQYDKPRKIKELTCSSCGVLKKDSDFYSSYSQLHSATGRIPYCKDCIQKMCCDTNGNILMDKIYDMLKLIDRPFIYELWQVSLEENKGNPIGAYFKNLGLTQNRKLTWGDSVFDVKTEGNNNSKPQIIDVKQTNRLEDFELTDEIIDKWGFGYSKEEYYYFEKKWLKLIDNYGEKTSFHIEGLITYIRFRVKEELATARGDIREAKDWGSMAKDAATAAKINVSQLSKADLSGGVELLPQLFEAVESKVGVINILPKLKEQPYDDADMIIWTTINYLRRLEDKPRISYREIWKFYDEMLEEHYKSKGYNKKQIQNEKKKRNNIFNDLEKVYVEPIYEDGDE